MEECSGYGLECWSGTEDSTATVSYYDEEAPAAAGGGVKKGNGIDQHTTEAASKDTVGAVIIADDGTVVGDILSEGHPTATGEEAPALGATGEEANSEQQAFVIALVTIALFGMGLLTFAILAFGKIGMCVTNIFGSTATGAVDIAVMAINDEDAPQATMQNKIFKRALCWLANGVLGLVLQSISWLSFDQKKHEESIWQPEAFVYESVYKLAYQFGLALVLIRAHRDRRPTVAV